MARQKVDRTTDTAVRVEGVKELLKVLRQAPKELNAEVRDAAQGIADLLVTASQQAASTRQQQLAASGLKAKRDRIPVVRVPSTMLRPGLRASDIFFGAEFGGRRRPSTMQFQPHMGRRGYFLYPTARSRGKEFGKMWEEAIDKAMKDWDYTPP